MYEAGTVLKIDCGAFFHYGIANGQGMVVHNSKKRMMVALDSYEEFSDGKKIIVSDIMGIDALRAVKLANKYIGLSYSLFQENCEHFVRMCHGLEKESTQIQRAVLFAVSLTTCLRAENPAVRAAGIAGGLGAFSAPPERNPIKYTIIFALIGGGIALIASR